MWHGLPQTAPGAETAAAAAISDTLSMSTRPHQLIGDNKTVVNIVNNPPDFCSLHKLHYAGIWRTARMKVGWKLICGNGHHIKSHQLEGPDAVDLSAIDPEARHRLLGNQFADEAAEAGQALHSPLTLNFSSWTSRPSRQVKKWFF